MRAVAFALAVHQVAAGNCCWSHWGDASSCGLYPSDGQGAICGNDGVTKCTSNSDCDNPAPPAPPAPTPDPTPTPTPSPTPTPAPTPGPSPIAPTGDVSGCHDAAKAFCNDGHGFCRACQGYGTWGNMFFVANCNDGTVNCNLLNLAGDVCQCQQAGGCKAGSASCPAPGSELFAV